MTIEVACGCGKKLKVPDAMAGKKGKCPSCGAAVEVPVPAPAAKASASAPLELELEDFKVQKPSDDVIVAAMTVPEKESKLSKSSKVSKAPKSGTTPTAGAAPPPGMIACPKCHAPYDKDTLFCIACAIDLATGLPISGVLPGRGGMKKRAGDDFDPQMPFWKITLQMIYQPHKIMEFFPSLFERKDVLVQMVAFYVLSFVCLGIGASQIGKDLKDKVAGPSDEERAAELEKSSPFDAHAPATWTSAGTGGTGIVYGSDFVFRVNEPKEGFSAGDLFTLNMSFCEPGPGKGLDCDVWLIETEGWGLKEEYGADWEQGRPAGQPGDFAWSLRAPVANGISYAVRVYAKGETPFDPGKSYRGTVNIAIPAATGWGMKQIAAEKEGEKLLDIPEEEWISRKERRKGTLKAPKDWTDGVVDSRGEATGEPYKYRFLEPPAEVEAGGKFTLKIEIKTPNQADPAAGPEEPFTGDVWFFNPGYVGDNPNGHWVGGARGEAGSYSAELDAVLDRESQVRIKLYTGGGNPSTDSRPKGIVDATLPSRTGWARKLLEREKAEFEKEKSAEAAATPAPTATGEVKKALKGGSAVMGAILGNLVGLLIAAACFTLAARMFGGGGTFLLMLITLAYLAAFANIIQIGMIFVPEKDIQWVQYLAWAYSFILTLIALMKVYDLDFMGAFLTNVVAGFIQFFVVTWAMIALLGTAAVVAS